MHLPVTEEFKSHSYTVGKSARALSSIASENDRTKFLLGTVGLESQNEVCNLNRNYKGAFTGL
jgi:hypothetical protein